VNAVEDFSAYLEVVQTSVGPTCAAVIQQASNTMDTLMKTEQGRNQIRSQFSTCTPIVTNLDVATFVSDISGTISGVVQYNMDNTNYEPCDIPTMCNMIETSSTDPVQAVANFINFANNKSGVPCVEVNYTQMLVDMAGTGDGRSWTYQTCIEFGFFQTAETDAQPFSKSLTLQYFRQICNDLFGSPLIPDTAWTNTNYGAVSVQTTNTFMPNGDVDPWHKLGVYRQPGPGSASLLIQGTAHCADLYIPRAQDLPTLGMARQMALELLSQWLVGASPSTKATADLE